MCVMLDCIIVPFVLRKKMKLFLMVATVALRNAKEAMMGSGRSLRLAGFRGCVLCWCSRHDSGFSLRKDVFTFK
jgi:hypothetical protein